RPRKQRCSKQGFGRERLTVYGRGIGCDGSAEWRRVMSLFGKTLNSMEDLFINQIEDLYDAEKRITKALPKMIDAATSSNLKEALQHHLTETEGHVTRL